MLEFLLVCDHVKDDRPDAFFREATQLRSDLRITTDEVWTIRLKSQKREKPITVLMKLAGLPSFTESLFSRRNPYFPLLISAIHDPRRCLEIAVSLIV